MKSLVWIFPLIVQSRHSRFLVVHTQEPRWLVSENTELENLLLEITYRLWNAPLWAFGSVVRTPQHFTSLSEETCTKHIQRAVCHVTEVCVLRPGWQTGWLTNMGPGAEETTLWVNGFLHKRGDMTTFTSYYILQQKVMHDDMCLWLQGLPGKFKKILGLTGQNGEL